MSNTKKMEIFWSKYNSNNLVSIDDLKLFCYNIHNTFKGCVIGFEFKSW